MDEFYKRFRPKTLKGIVGQDNAVASLQTLMEKKRLPHTILLNGPSGCGKTTVARILKDFLVCGDQDFIEVNGADARGVDTIRDIRRSVGMSPMSGETKVWLIDEAHKLTNDAQNAFLKLLEDTPRHVYFMLATTDPGKLIKTILTRSTEIKFVAIPEEAMKRVLQRVIDKERLDISENVIEAIIEAAQGSARKALVILEQVAGLDGETAQIAAVEATNVNKVLAIELARALFDPKPWPAVAKILTDLKDDEPEGIRYLILGYYRSVLLKGGKFAPKAFMIIDIFSKNFYDSKHAGLAAACYEVCFPEKS